MNIKLRAITFFVLLFSFTSCYATDNNELIKQRTLYKQATNALNTHKISQFKALKERLDDYPLVPYLDYLFLRHRLTQTDSRVISAFIEKNNDTFFGQRLQSSWLQKLAKEKQWHLFLDKFPAHASTSLQCLRLQALYSTGQQTQAINESLALWLVPYSQEKECDFIFKKAEAKKRITDSLRQQRINLALAKSEFKLARYLAKSLTKPKATQDWIQQWQQMYSNPASVLQKVPKKTHSSQTKKLSSDNAATRQLLAYGIDQLSRKSLEDAYNTWQKIKPRYKFTQQEQQAISAKIAKRAALNHDANTLKYFGDLPNQEWRVRAALWQQNWPEVKKAILSLDLTLQESNRWRYWLARAENKLGNKKQAKTIFQNIAGDRDYYSFLSADILKTPYQMNHNPIKVDVVELEKLTESPSVKRLREFYALDMYLESRREAHKLKTSLSSHELQLLSTITHQWGWHDQSIAILGKARYWDAIDIRFPIVHKAAILKAGQVNDIDPAWLFGIARQESAFNPKARSPVGARGLMQLMPKTAKSIAKTINRPLTNLSDLSNPARNVELGSAYLKHVYEENQQNPVLATTSYNAGPNRVRSWLPEHPLPADIWIENIPFNETRSYAINVLSYAAIFDYQLKLDIKRLSDRMPIIKPLNDKKK